jgi:hypothetical protein
LDATALEGVNAKLARAEKHLQALDSELAAYAEKNPYSFRGEVQTETSRWVARVEVREPIPIELSITVGDIVHNLRSALDHIAFALVPKANRRRTMFPIYDDPEEFLCAVRVPAKRKRGPLGGLSPDSPAFALIESAQPYAGGNPPDSHHPLRILAALNNEDKHRTILARSMALTNDPSPALTVVAGWHVEPAEEYTVNVNKLLEDGAEIASADVTITGPEPNMHVAYELHFEVAFGKEGVTAYSLTLLRDAVAKIVEAACQIGG